MRLDFRVPHPAHALPVRLVRTDDTYGYCVAWRLERELVGRDARLEMLTSSTPSVPGPTYTVIKDICTSQATSVCFTFQRRAPRPSTVDVASLARRRSRLASLFRCRYG